MPSPGSHCHQADRLMSTHTCRQALTQLKNQTHNSNSVKVKLITQKEEKHLALTGN